jgi:hypothetical protein
MANGITQEERLALGLVPEADQFPGLVEEARRPVPQFSNRPSEGPSIEVEQEASPIQAAAPASPAGGNEMSGLRRALFAIGDFGSGVIGQDGPSRVLIEQRRKAENDKLDRAIRIQGLLSDRLEQRSKLPLDLIPDFDKQNKETFAEFGIDYPAFSKSSAASVPLLATPGERRIAEAGGSMDDIAAYRRSKAGRDEADSIFDQENAGTVRSKLEGIRTFFAQSDPDILKDGFRLTELQAANRNLPEHLRLTQGEMSSLVRNEKQYNDILETASVAESRQRTAATAEERGSQPAEAARQLEGKLLLKIASEGPDSLSDDERAFLAERKNLSFVNRLLLGIGTGAGAPPAGGVGTNRAATQSDVDAATRSLTDRLGREPTTQEIRQRMDEEGFTF